MTERRPELENTTTEILFRFATSRFMGDILTLDDGRLLSRSSMGISGLLHLVAEHLPDGHDQLRLWLHDVSDRPNGFVGIDLRGLPTSERDAFHQGARNAYKCTIGQGAEITAQSWALATLDAFIAMQDSIRRGDPPDSLTDCGVTASEPFVENINELWKPDVNTGAD